MSPKESIFVREYLASLNAYASAKKAGFSESVAKRASVDILRKPLIKAAIQAEMDKRAATVGITADWVLTEILKLAGCDVADCFDENGALKPIKDIPEGARKAVSGIDTEQRVSGRGENAEIITTKKLRFWPKDRALELLGKHLKLFTDVHEHHLGKGLAERMQKARQRASSR
jgi:phage terminase small subunit